MASDAGVYHIQWTILHINCLIPLLYHIHCLNLIMFNHWYGEPLLKSILHEIARQLLDSDVISIINNHLRKTNINKKNIMSVQSPSNKKNIMSVDVMTVLPWCRSPGGVHHGCRLYVIFSGELPRVPVPVPPLRSAPSHPGAGEGPGGPWRWWHGMACQVSHGDGQFYKLKTYIKLIVIHSYT